MSQTRKLWNEQLSPPNPPNNQPIRKLVFHPTPDDLYEFFDGADSLPCSKSLPVVRRVGLALTGFSTSQIPGVTRSLNGLVPEKSSMLFPDTTGTREFVLDSLTWRQLLAEAAASADHPGSLQFARLALPGLTLPSGPDTRSPSPFSAMVMPVFGDRLLRFR